MRADLGRRAGRQHLAEIEHGHAVADVEDQVGMMLDQQHAGAGAADRLDQRAEPPDLLGRQAGRRLVEHQAGRAQHQGAGDLDEAQLAVLQAVGAHGGELTPARRWPAPASPPRADAPRRGDGAAGASSDSAKLPWPSIVPPIITFSSTDAAPISRGVWKVRAMRCRRAQCGARERQVGCRPACTLPCLRRVVAGDHVQRRGLAAAVGADQAVHLARPDLEIEPVDRPHAAEAAARCP